MIQLTPQNDHRHAGRPATERAIEVKGGNVFVGTDTPQIVEDGEGPERSVRLRDYMLEAATVTVRRFAEFVNATGYLTDSERIGSSTVFMPLLETHNQSRENDTVWWSNVKGANWRSPEGPGSSVEDRMDHPVTQVSWSDASAFAAWVGGRLPTEPEWEHAARSGHRGRVYPWGDDEPDDNLVFCNIWQGKFPHNNTEVDGYFGTAPSESFAPNELGFYNLAGNVWEWTADAFKIRSVASYARTRNQAALRASDKVLKGGSFLCHRSYCYRYRIAARIGLSRDSASSNVGFRVAFSPDCSSK